ncbi:MAG TPA: transglutaminase family protein, partial [Chlamydiales bacterium]|nr:transglutaminase family protein [Chlamydiales bacterium]
MMLHLFCLFLLTGDTTALYNSLEPTSISQHLAFHILYPDSDEGKKALEDAAKLMQVSAAELHQNVRAFLQLTHKSPPPLSDATLQNLQKLGVKLLNRSLKGFSVVTEKEIKDLKDEEIDLAHALLAIQKQQKSYEVMLDCLALELLAHLPPQATDQEKVDAINKLLFFDLGIRFPPHSISEQAIDTYTDLPSILDSRRGVCLGVSTLYIALAQRLNLPLQIITPPGHIYLASNDTNIETTARGIHIPSEEYLGINERALKTRTLKEVLGMVWVNQGSHHMSASEWKKANECYEKAAIYMPNDRPLLTFYAASCIMLGREKEATALLQKAIRIHDPTLICQDTLTEDLLQKNYSKSALQALFCVTDGTRKKEVEKKQALEKALQECPQFRTGLIHLASVNIDLHHMKEALKLFEQVYALDQNFITVAYVLTAL